MRGWNQIIVRSLRGKALLEMAVLRGALEIREAPASALQELKTAAADKKRKALKNIVEKSRSIKNLLYLNSDDPVVRKYLERKSKFVTLVTRYERRAVRKYEQTIITGQYKGFIPRQ